MQTKAMKSVITWVACAAVLAVAGSASAGTGSTAAAAANLSPKEAQIFEAISGTDARLRGDALRDLEAMGPAGVDVLLLLLGHREWEMRLHAVKALGKAGDPRAVEPLVPMLDDREYVVRGAAATSLGKLKDPRVVPKLVLLARTDKASYSNMKALIVAMGEIGDPYAVRYLMQAAEQMADPACRDEAHKALDKITGQKHGADLAARKAWLEKNQPDWMNLETGRETPRSFSVTMGLIFAGLAVGGLVVFFIWRSF